MKKFDYKKLILLVLIFAMCFTLFAACDKEPEGEGGGTTPPPTPPAKTKTASEVALTDGLTALQNTINAVAKAPQDGKLGVGFNAGFTFSNTPATGEATNIAYSLDVKAGVDLLNDDDVNKAQIIVKDGTTAIATLTLDGEYLFVDVPAGDLLTTPIKAKIELGSIYTALNNAGLALNDKNVLYSYTDIDLMSTVSGMLGMISGFFAPELTADGAITLSEDASSLISDLLPTILKDFDVSSIISSLGLGESTTIADLLAMVNLGLDLKFDVSADKMLTGIALSVKISENATGKAALVAKLAKESKTLPATFTGIPTLAIGLNIGVELNDAIVVPAIAEADKAAYTTVNALNGEAGGIITIDDGDPEVANQVYYYDFKCNLDPMALLANKPIGISAANVAGLGKAYLVLRSGAVDGPIVVEAFFDSSVSNHAYATVNYTGKDSETNYDYILSGIFANYFTDKAAASKEEYATFAEAEEAGESFDILGSLGTIIDLAMSVFADFDAENAKPTFFKFVAGTTSTNPTITVYPAGIINAVAQFISTDAVTPIVDDILGKGAASVKVEMTTAKFFSWDKTSASYTGLATNLAEVDYITDIAYGAEGKIALAVGDSLADIELPVAITVNGAKKTVTAVCNAASDYNPLLSDDQKVLFTIKSIKDAGYENYMVAGVFSATVNFEASSADLTVVNQNGYAPVDGKYYVAAGTQLYDVVTVSLGDFLLNKGSITDADGVLDDAGCFKASVIGTHKLVYKYGDKTKELTFVVVSFSLQKATLTKGAKAVTIKLSVSYVDTDGKTATKVLAPDGLTDVDATKFIANSFTASLGKTEVATNDLFVFESSAVKVKPAAEAGTYTLNISCEVFSGIVINDTLEVKYVAAA